MNTRWRLRIPVIVLTAISTWFEVTPTLAQIGGRPRSLGGYGASTIGSYYRNQGNALIPYGGGHGGFIPYQGLESTRRTQPVMAPAEIAQTPIGGAGMVGTPIGGASQMKGPKIYQPLKYRGRFGKGGSSGFPRRYGPGFGSPFRSPASLGTAGM